MTYKYLKLSSSLFLLIIMLSLTSCSFEKDSEESLPIKSQQINNKTIIALGDSLTAGYNLPIDETYPYYLQEILDKEGYKYEVQNAGISGETSAGTLSRVNWILNANPDIIILTIGGNDALRGLSTQELKNNIEQIVSFFKDANVEVLLVGLKSPRNMGPDFVRDFDKVYKEVAEKNNLDFMPFLLDQVATIEELNQDDGIHPNKEGNKIVAKNVFKYLKGLLSR